MRLYNVVDKRNSNKQGPYTLQDAVKLAKDLNAFVAANGVKGKPFYHREIK